MRRLHIAAGPAGLVVASSRIIVAAVAAVTPISSVSISSTTAAGVGDFSIATSSRIRICNLRGIGSLALVPRLSRCACIGGRVREQD
jgi:hypothetical protein